MLQYPSHAFCRDLVCDKWQFACKAWPKQIKIAREPSRGELFVLWIWSVAFKGDWNCSWILFCAPPKLKWCWLLVFSTHRTRATGSKALFFSKPTFKAVVFSCHKSIMAPQRGILHIWKLRRQMCRRHFLCKLYSIQLIILTFQRERENFDNFLVVPHEYAKLVFERTRPGSKYVEGRLINSLAFQFIAHYYPSFQILVSHFELSRQIWKLTKVSQRLCPVAPLRGTRAPWWHGNATLSMSIWTNEFTSMRRRATSSFNVSLRRTKANISALCPTWPDPENPLWPSFMSDVRAKLWINSSAA